MPTIDKMSYGYDTEGVNDYLEKIKSTALVKAQEAVQDISGIKKCCEEEWAGKARDNFIQNLQSDAKYVSEQFATLYNNLVNEITSINAAMANKDEDLIKVS